MFRAAHNWGIAPSEFWAMTMAEWYEIAEIHIADQGVAGTSITEERHDAIKEWARKKKEERALANDTT
jgi:hypothetical protein